MRKNSNFVTKKLFIFNFLLLSLAANAQHFTVTLANLTTTTTTFEVDILLIVDAPSQGVRLSSCSFGINYNPAILNFGSPCTTASCGSWSMIYNTISPELVQLNSTLNTNRISPVGHLRATQAPLPGNLAIDILPGTYSLGRYRFTNTVPWTANSDLQLWISGDNIGGSTNTIVIFYPYGTITPASAYTTTAPINGTGLTLGYTQSSPLSRILNPGLNTPENSTSDLQVYPNPFSTTFNLNFETISNEQISVKVYDMIGKLIENRIVEATTINSVALGENYQAGIYNVIVSQGEKNQNIRVIKK